MNNSPQLYRGRFLGRWGSQELGEQAGSEKLQKVGGRKGLVPVKPSGSATWEKGRIFNVGWTGCALRPCILSGTLSGTSVTLGLWP